MPDVPDLPVHYQTVGNGKGAPVLQVFQHCIFVMQSKNLLLVFWMHIFTDTSSALGKKNVPRSRHIQFFIVVCRRNLTVSAGRDIDIIQRIILFRQACGNLVINLLLPGDFLIDFPLPVLRINIIEPDYQPGTFFFFHHGGVHLHIKGAAFHHEPVNQCKQAVVPDRREDIVFGKNREKTVQIFRMIMAPSRFPDRAKKIRPVLGLGKGFHIAVGRAELAVTIRFRVHHIDNNKIAGDGMETGINNPFFLNPFEFGVRNSTGFLSCCIILMHMATSLS